MDGDKNTTILDLAGTLTGYKVVDKDDEDVPGAWYTMNGHSDLGDHRPHS